MTGHQLDLVIEAMTRFSEALRRTSGALTRTQWVSNHPPLLHKGGKPRRKP